MKKREPNDRIKMLQSIIQFKQKSDEWLEQRKSKLTASDFATALGLNPYETPESLLFKKCGVSKPFSNKYTKHGEKYESEAIDWYCKLMNKTNFEFGMIAYDQIKDRVPTKLDKLAEMLNIDLSFLAGSPDGISLDNDSENLPHEAIYMEPDILIEVKCPASRKIIIGQIPEYYVPQVQGNMTIFNLFKSDFIEYLPNEYDPSKRIINIVRSDFNEEWACENVPKLWDFWKQVLYWRQCGIENHPEYEKYRKLANPEPDFDLEYAGDDNMNNLSLEFDLDNV